MFKGEIVYDDDYLFSVSKVFTLCGEKISFTVNSEMCFEMYRKLAEFSKIKEKFIENFGPAITDDTMFYNKLKEYMHCVDDIQSYLEDILAQDEIFDIDAEDVIKLHLPEALCEFEEYISDMHDLDSAAQKLGSYRAIQRETRDTGADMMFFGGAGIKGAMSAVLTSVVAGASVAAIQSVGDSITASNDKKLINKELVKLHKKYNFAKLFGSSLNKLIGGIMTEYTLIVKTRVPRYKYVEREVAKFKSSDTSSVVLNNLEKQYSKNNISCEVFTSKIMQLIQENPYNYKCYNAILRYVPAEAKNVNEIISFMGMEEMFEGTIYQNFENILNDYHIEKYPHNTTYEQVKEDYYKLRDLKKAYSNYEKFSEDIQIRINLYAEVVALMELFNKQTIYDFLNCDKNGGLYSVENALKKYRERYADEKKRQDKENKRREIEEVCFGAMERFEKADLDFNDFSKENLQHIKETFSACFGANKQSYIYSYERIYKHTEGYKKYTDYLREYPEKSIMQKLNASENCSIDFSDYSEKNMKYIISFEEKCLEKISQNKYEDTNVYNAIKTYMEEYANRQVKAIVGEFIDVSFTDISLKNAYRVKKMKKAISDKAKQMKAYGSIIENSEAALNCNKYQQDYYENICYEIPAIKSLVNNNAYDESVKHLIQRAFDASGIEKYDDIPKDNSMKSGYMHKAWSYIRNCDSITWFDWSFDTAGICWYINPIVFLVCFFGVLISSFIFSPPMWLKVMFSIIVVVGIIQTIVWHFDNKGDIDARISYKNDSCRNDVRYEHDFKKIDNYLMENGDYRYPSVKDEIIIPEGRILLHKIISVLVLLLIAVAVYNWFIK